MELPIITVKKDYDDYFRRLVLGWCLRKIGPFQHKEIVISAGLYRASAVAFESRGDVLHLDFYSALRNGFGELTAQDRVNLINIL